MPGLLADFLFGQNLGTPLGVFQGKFVQLVDNVTGNTIVSATPSNAQGQFQISNVPAGSYALSTGGSAAGPWTLVDPGYTVGASPDALNILDFGGKADGSTDNTAALTAALAALPSTGGTIFFPGAASAYVFSSAWNLSGKSFIRLQGGGPVLGGGSSAGAQIKFTTTSGPLISATTSTGIEFVDLMIQWPNAFSGVVLAYDGTAGTPTILGRVSRCFFEATGGGSNAGLLVSLDDVIDTEVSFNQFHNANCAVQGIGTSGHFSNTITVHRNIFSSSTGDISSAMLRNLGQGWDITSNVFEMGQTAGNVVIVQTTLGNGGTGINFTGNWSGDQGTNAVTQITAGGAGWNIAGNYLFAGTASTPIGVANNATGINIGGNSLSGAVGIALGTSITNIQIGPNDHAGCTTYVTGTPSAGGFLLTNGTMVFYGAAQVQGDFSTDRGIGPGTPAVGTQSGRMYMGSGVPSNSNGNNGDFYFRTDTPGTANQRLYNKQAGTWTGIL